MKEAVLQGCIGDDDMFSEVEASFERALRDAAMQKLALFGLALRSIRPLTTSVASCAVMSISFSPKPATAIVIR